jgi:trigger factor
MKVETEQLPDGEVALSFEVEDARVERAMDAAYKRVANKVDISGFRRGKAPRQLVERVVGRESLMEEALNTLLPEVYEEALRESNVDAVSEPEFDVESFNPLRAKATVIVRPTVELGDYRSIARDLPEQVVSEDEINLVLDQLRERHVEWVPAERAAEVSDRVTMDITGTADEETIISQEDVDYVLDPESNAPLPGFAEKLVGIAAGEERSFDIAVDSESENPRLAGKTVTFQVTVKDVKAKELPELDDFFATTVGTYKDLDELRADVTEQLRSRGEVSSRRAMEEEVLEEAVKGSTLSIPDKLIDYQAQRTLERLARDLDSHGLSIEQYIRLRGSSEDDLRTEFREQADRTLRRDFVLRAIAANEDMEISDDDLDEGIRAALSTDGSDQRAVARALKNPEVREGARGSLLESRAVQWLIEHAIREPAPAPSGEPEPEAPEPEAEDTKAHD